MSIKIEDIKPGDEVTLKPRTVCKVDWYRNEVLVEVPGYVHNVWLPLSDIADHTPAPVEFEPGDEVRSDSLTGIVKGVDGALCWIWFPRPANYSTRLKCDLTLIRKAEPK